MALKVTPTLVKDVKVGDHFARRNVLKGKTELMRITLIRHNPGSTRYALNYADAKTGQQVDYLALNGDDTIEIIDLAD